MKKIIFGLLLFSINGCVTYKKELIKKDFNHEIYIAVENAVINNEPACILGGKIKNAIEKRDAKLSKLE